MIEQEEILFTGGSGLLGGEIKKLLPDAHYPTRKEFDFTNDNACIHKIENKQIKLVVHMGANTDTVGIETIPHEAMLTNIAGTCNIAMACLKTQKRMIYISTDYVFEGTQGNYKEDEPLKPVNTYGWSKLGGECAVRMMTDSLIVRTSFGSNEFPYSKAFNDQYTSRMTVKEFAEALSKIVMGNEKGILHIGKDRRTVYDMAKGISPEKDIEPISLEEMREKGYTLPKDTSLDCSKAKKLGYIKNK